MPALPVVGMLVWWTAREGGYLPTTWLPSALLVLALLVASAWGIGLDRLRLSRAGAVALGALAAYAAWSYLSIAWAASPGDALDGSNRTLLYLLLFALFALLPWRAWGATAVLTLFALGVGAIAIVTLIRLGAAGTVPSLFGDGRLKTPLGYANANAAMFLIETVLAVALAARRELPPALRALLLACASAALSLSLLAQSRGWLFALPVVVAIAFALVPGRLRLALWSLPVAAAGLLTLSPLLDVFRLTDAAATPAAATAALADAAGSASGAALLAVAGVFAAGLALALLDRRVAVPAAVARHADRVAAVLAVVALAGGVAVALVATDGRPDRELADYWDRSHGYQRTEAGTSRFGAVGSNRPDFWEVSWDAFLAHPVGGLGQDNWGDYYLRERTSDEQPRWTHSLELRLLAHTGAVGLLLFAAFLVAVAAAALHGRRRPAPADRDGPAPPAAAAPAAPGPAAAMPADAPARPADGPAPPPVHAVAAIALLPLVVWLAHGSVDWFWEIPALSGPAFAFAGMAVALPAVAAADAAVEPPPRSRPLTAAAGAAGAVLAAVALAFPYLAERYTTAAARGWHEHPGKALARLDRAADLNPLSARADMTAGVIALELDDPRLARQRFDRALERDPDDWFAHFGRGLAESALGDVEAARADYRAARTLNPDDPLVIDALTRVAGPRPLGAEAAFSRLRRQVRSLTGAI